MIGLSDASLKSITVHENTRILAASDLAGTVLTQSIFEGSDVETVTLPDGLVYIGGAVFANATKLRTVKIPAGVGALADEVFAGCTSLESVTLADGLTSIGKSAFAGTTALKEITSPASVRFIGELAFDEKSGVERVLCEAENEPVGWNVQWIYDPSAAVFGAKK